MRRAGFQVDPALPDSPKLAELERAVGPEALGCVVRLWCYTARDAQAKHTGCLGFMRPHVLESICEWRGPPGLLWAGMARLGWIDVTPEGEVTIHDWHAHQPYLVEAGERSRRASASARARWHKGVRRERPNARKDAAVSTAKVSRGFYEWVRKTWNAVAKPRGFAEVRKINDYRRRAINATVREFGESEERWRRAFRAYTQDADRWPGRTEFGLDTFLRPCHRAKWFEAPEPPQRKPLEGWDMGDA